MTDSTSAETAAIPGIELLGALDIDTRARIQDIEDLSQPELCHRLMEMGFIPGAEIEIVHEAPFFKDPMIVRVRGALIALRRAEASLIRVTISEK